MSDRDATALKAYLATLDWEVARARLNRLLAAHELSVAEHARLHYWLACLAYQRFDDYRAR
jgi:hypothetical protein